MERFIRDDIDKDALDKFFRELHGGGTELQAIEIYERGEQLVRWAVAPYCCEDKRESYSLSKSFTATAVGIAFDQKLLHPDDLLVKYFPGEIAAESDPRWQRVCLRHLLTMTTGHNGCAMPQMAFAPNAMTAFFETPLEYEPGKHFAYSTGASCVLAEVVRRVSGRSVLDFLTEYLFMPLGIENVSWDQCLDGHNQGGTGIKLCCDDIAKFGLLYVQNGMWKGRRLLSEEWIRMATAKQVATPDNGTPDWSAGYGFQFWQNDREGFRGDGAFGQLCIVLPERQMVVAITAESTDMNQEVETLWQLLDNLKGDTPGAGLPAGYRPVGTLTAGEQDSGWLTCEKNDMGFTGMRLQKDAAGVRLCINDGQRSQSIIAVAGEWTENHFLARNLKPLLYRQMPRSEVAELDFVAAVHQAGDDLVLECRLKNSPHFFTITLHFAGQRLTARIGARLDVFGQSSYWRSR